MSVDQRLICCYSSSCLGWHTALFSRLNTFIQHMQTHKHTICSYCDVRCINVVRRLLLRRRQAHSRSFNCTDRTKTSASCSSDFSSENWSWCDESNIFSLSRQHVHGLTRYHRAVSVLAAVAVLQSGRVVGLLHPGVTNQLWRNTNICLRLSDSVELQRCFLYTWQQCDL